MTMLEQTSLHSRVIFLMCGFRGHLDREEATLLYMSWESKGKCHNKLYNNPRSNPVFLDHHTADFYFKQKQLPTFCPICPSYLVRSESPRPHKKKRKKKKGTITSQLTFPQNTPVVHTCFLAQSVLCVPYKPCHALLFTIFAPTPSEGGGRKKRWDRR